jgi:hypothetical protein
MKSTPRDTDRRTATVSTLLPITAAMTSFNGAFSDGTPFQMVRTATGIYEFYFDPRLIPLSGFVGLHQNARIMPNIGAMNPGRMQVNFLLHDGTDVNAQYDLNINWLDTRT